MGRNSKCVKCSQIKPDGTRCKGWAYTGYELCVAHMDPDTAAVVRAEIKAKAEVKAAKKAARPPKKEPKRERIRTKDDIVRGASELAWLVKDDQITTDKARTIIACWSTILAALGPAGGTAKGVFELDLYGMVRPKKPDAPPV